MAVVTASRFRTAALACAALALGCAAPKVLYEGPPLPREKVALLRGLPSMSYREGREGKGNSVAATGRVVVIGLDGRVFNPRVHAAYSGDDFIVTPGRHALLAYCQHTTHGQGPDRTLYSDLFTVTFTARGGRTYRYQADFSPGHGRGVQAEPGVWDVTENRSADSSNRVDEGSSPVPVVHPTLSRIQAAVGSR